MSDTHGVNGEGWIGFDLDGTLAKYDGWQGLDHIGEPIEAIVRLAPKGSTSRYSRPGSPRDFAARLMPTDANAGIARKRQAALLSCRNSILSNLTIADSASKGRLQATSGNGATSTSDSPQRSSTRRII